MKPARVRPLACALLPAALALAYAACSTDNAALPTSDVTNLYVDPVYFRGDVPCGNLQGAMQSYVLTLTDVSVDPPVTLPSSPPTPCSQLVGFNDKLIVADHQYAATIDAYGEPPCNLLATNAPCLVPFGGLYNSGARAMALVEREDAVLPNNPAWRPLRQAESAWPVVRCDAETALLLASRRFTSCTPLELLKGQSSGIAISLDQIRGGLPCASAKVTSGTSVSRIKVEVVSVVGGTPSGPTNGAARASSSAGSAGASTTGSGLRANVLAGASGDAGASGEAGAGGEAGANGSAGSGGGAGTGGAGGGAAGSGGDAGAGGSAGSGDAGTGGNGGSGGSAGGPASGCDGTSDPIAGQICELLCEPGAKLVYPTNNNVTATYSFRVTVFDGNGVLRWVTSCSGEPIKNIGDLPIACDSLSSSLSLRIPFAVLTEAYTKRFPAEPLACAASAGAPGLVDVTADRGQGLPQTFSCGSALSFEALPAGAYSIRGTFNVRGLPEGPIGAKPFFCEGYALPDDASSAPGDAAPSPLRCQFF